jgi:hypothetical protein
MNKHAIDQALDADLRHSQQAMQRAAVRARETARQTGTSIVVCRNGVVEYLQPQQDHAASVTPESPTSGGADKQ